MTSWLASPALTVWEPSPALFVAVQDKSGSLSLQEPQDFVILPHVIEKWIRMTSDCFYLNHLKSLKADWNPSCSVVMAFHNASCYLLPLCWLHIHLPLLPFWVDCNSEPSWYRFDALSRCTLQVRMLETCRGFHHKGGAEFELILPVTSTGQIGQCLKCSSLWATSPPARRLFERLSASNLRPVYPGTSWYACTLLIFVVACTWLVPLYIPIYILYTFYTLFVCLCLSEFIVAPAAWTTVVAQARGGSGPRLSATMPAPQQRPSVVIDSDNLQSALVSERFSHHKMSHLP